MNKTILTTAALVLSAGVTQAGEVKLPDKTTQVTEFRFDCDKVNPDGSAASLEEMAQAIKKSPLWSAVQPQVDVHGDSYWDGFYSNDDLKAMLSKGDFGKIICQVPLSATITEGGWTIKSEATRKSKTEDTFERIIPVFDKNGNFIGASGGHVGGPIANPTDYVAFMNQIRPELERAYGRPVTEQDLFNLHAKGVSINATSNTKFTFTPGETKISLNYGEARMTPATSSEKKHTCKPGAMETIFDQGYNVSGRQRFGFQEKEFDCNRKGDLAQRMVETAHKKAPFAKGLTELIVTTKTPDGEILQGKMYVTAGDDGEAKLLNIGSFKEDMLKAVRDGEPDIISYTRGHISK